MPFVLISVKSIHVRSIVLPPNMVNLEQIVLIDVTSVADSQRPVLDGFSKGLPHTTGLRQ